MPLSKGDRLGPYEILALVGQGGMGEVYRAHDDRLRRDVAIKVSNAQFTERFTIEARSIAALNHTNICHLYDVGPNYLVMEYVEGEDLKGPLDFNDALPIVQQLVDGIEAAHEKNIVHRDLKPANIKITHEGVVKILDFGLAKAMDPNPPSGSNAANSPTLTIGATAIGTILGTAGYMAPEQAKGKAADKRSDIWSFGVILFELLTGKRMFPGETAVEILGGVLNKEPDIGAAPARVHRLLRWCLEKDRKERLASISDARRLLAEEDESTAPSQSRLGTGGRLGMVGWILGAAASVLAAALAVLAFLHFREQPPPAPDLVRFQISPPDKGSFFSTLMAVSPDGRRLVFSSSDPEGRTQLWVRSLDSLEARALPGTESGTDPFWAPDSRFLAFLSDGKLRKIDVTGGPPQTLCDVAGFGYIAGDWNREGVILFAAPTAGVMRVSAAGGPPAAVTTLDQAGAEIYHRKPTFLPDGRHFLYMRVSSPEETGVYVGSIDAKPEQKSKRLVATRAFFAYAPSTEAQASTGHLLLFRDGTLIAQAFDTQRLELLGDPVPVAEKVAAYGNVGAMFSVSSNGTLVYRSGGNSGASRLTWYDRQGKILGPAGIAGDNLEVALSPDGARAAMRVRQASNEDIWLLEFARGALTRLTFDPSRDGSPVWSPDGTRVAFASARNGFFDLYWHFASGAGEDHILLKSPEMKSVQDWSRDGRFLLYTTQSTNVGGATAPGQTRDYNLWVLPMQGPGAPKSDADKPVPFLTTPANEIQARFSPDGHWVVYGSDESGRLEVYVQPFPADAGGGGRWMISTAGGSQPHWRRDGKEILYLAPDNKVMSAEISTVPVFKPGIPNPLFTAPIRGGAGLTTLIPFWDVTADGQRFLINSPVEESGSSPITVVMNWTAGLKK